MSVQKFEIKFDNPTCVYYVGQQVSGSATLITTKEKKIRGICLRVKGAADVYWTESRSVTGSDGNSETQTVTYSAHELYAHIEIWLVGSPCGEMMLPPGKHTYPFSYTLPHNIPSSFEGIHGHVRYTVKVEVVRPWRFDYKSKAAFTVLTPLDLNLEPGMQEPVQNTREKYLCCCCCRSGPVTLVCSVHRGFVPGQKIEAIVECDNVTTEEVSVNCYLEKVVTFKSSCGSTNCCQSMVAMERLGVVKANASNAWRTKLTVPVLPPSHLKYCNYIDITYLLWVKGVITGFHNTVFLRTEVIIGTIPLRNYFLSIFSSVPEVPSGSASPQGEEPPPSFESAVVAPSAPPMEPGSLYTDLPPPTYEECLLIKGNIRDKEDNEHTYGAMDFAPRYPMYNFR
ncbi:hypothetical protein R5R35_011957 [Gryllus longicercus]|uniref:Arrestin C-terminal-like domain-containing protein n=1 Tax=Gryllus longicercus TaxID=2509291 RepID=A0AAN9VBH5_9ORTH